MIPSLPCQPSSSAHSGPASDPAIEIPEESRNNNLNQVMVVPPADIPLPTLEEGDVSMSPRKREKLPATTIETKVMPTNDATYFTPKMPGEWCLIPSSVIP